MEANLQKQGDTTIDSGITSAYSRLTVEHLTYFLILLAGFILRAFDLGLVPLSPDEARSALAVWSFWENGSAVADVGSPIYFTLTALMSQLIGFSDSSVRLVPMIFGLAVIPLPLLISHRIGSVGAITASLLFALSPIHVFSSRIAGGQSAAIFAATLMFISWLRYWENGKDRWFYLLSAALGIVLISHSLFLGIVIALAAAWLISSRIGPRNDSESRSISTKPFRLPDKKVLSRGALIFLTIFLVGATAAFLNPGGIGATFKLLTDFLSNFNLTGDSVSLLEPATALIRYEPFLLVFGTGAAIWAVRRSLPLPLFLALWLITALIIALLQREDVTNLLILTIPAYFLIGVFVNRILILRIDRYQVAIAAILSLYGIILWANLARYSRLMSSPGSSADRYHLFLILAATALVGILLVLSWNWDRFRTRQGLIVGIFILLFAYSWGTAWWLSREAGNDTRELWIKQSADDDIRLLASTIKEASWQIENSDRDLDLISTIDDPSLHWYLRELDNYTAATTIARNTFPDALITPVDEIPLLQEGYARTRYDYSRSDTSHTLNFGQAIRWWLFHESQTAVNESSLMLWLRSDLVGESS